MNDVWESLSIVQRLGYFAQAEIEFRGFVTEDVIWRMARWTAAHE